MSIFVDTSALYAFLCRTDKDHEPVKRTVESLLVGKELLATSSYVLCETMGLIQRRMGFNLVQVLVCDLVPMMEVTWIGPREHNMGWSIMLEKRHRNLSIVDATSIAVMKAHGIRQCVALDKMFSRAGFEVLP